MNQIDIKEEIISMISHILDITEPDIEELKINEEIIIFEYLNSITIIFLIDMIEKRFQIRISPRNIYENPTIDNIVYLINVKISTK